MPARRDARLEGFPFLQTTAQRQRYRHLAQVALYVIDERRTDGLGFVSWKREAGAKSALHAVASL